MGVSAHKALNDVCVQLVSCATVGGRIKTFTKVKNGLPRHVRPWQFLSQNFEQLCKPYSVTGFCYNVTYMTQHQQHDLHRLESPFVKNLIPGSGPDVYNS